MYHGGGAVGGTLHFSFFIHTLKEAKEDFQYNLMMNALTLLISVKRGFFYKGNFFVDT